MEEIWKVLDENESYMISNLGRLKSIDREITTSNKRQVKLKGKIIKQRSSHKWIFAVSFTHS